MHTTPLAYEQNERQKGLGGGGEIREISFGPNNINAEVYRAIKSSRRGQVPIWRIHGVKNDECGSRNSISACNGDKARLYHNVNGKYLYSQQKYPGRRPHPHRGQV